ncbi:MAG: Do family serine endopeptidase [Gammaproteobacteria bacterium]|nr:MAG: Do family serine endopeptidase [Gammaproteobacteria bacterium]
MRSFFAACAATISLLPAFAAAAPPAAAPLPSFAPVIRQVAPAVVNIGVRGSVAAQRNPFFDDPGFRRFFGLPPDAAPREREFQSAGSGVIVDAAGGYIVTNAHVVENASEITVTLMDDRELKADIVGSDPRSDVAVLKVTNGRLPAEIHLADSARVEVGDFVIAIGNPFGLQHSVTSGIVSALGRSGINRENYEDFIQTDAAINPGNSGGALVSLAGELVGINTAILSRSGGNMGIGFAIPSNMVRTIMDQLIQHGQVSRGQLGVSILGLTPEYRKNLGLADEVQGALVAQVAEDSAAARAGIQVGDVITAVGGQPVKGAAELRNAIGMMKVGDEVELALLRDGRNQRLRAKLREVAQLADASTIHRALAGADLADAPEGGGGGVVVRGVQQGSPAAQSGLRPDDLIVAVNRARIANLAQLREAAREQDSLLLQLRRGNQLLILPLR